MSDIKLNHLHILLSPVGFLFNFLLLTEYSITQKKKKESNKQKKAFNVKDNIRQWQYNLDHALEK